MYVCGCVSAWVCVREMLLIGFCIYKAVHVLSRCVLVCECVCVGVYGCVIVCVAVCGGVRACVKCYSCSCGSVVLVLHVSICK